MPSLAPLGACSGLKYYNWGFASSQANAQLHLHFRINYKICYAYKLQLTRAIVPIQNSVSVQCIKWQKETQCWKWWTDIKANTMLARLNDKSNSIPMFMTETAMCIWYYLLEETAQLNIQWEDTFSNYNSKDCVGTEFWPISKIKGNSILISGLLKTFELPSIFVWSPLQQETL